MRAAHSEQTATNIIMKVTHNGTAIAQIISKIIIEITRKKCVTTDFVYHVNNSIFYKVRTFTIVSPKYRESSR